MAAPAAAQIRASLAQLRGERALALSEFERALALYNQNQMALYAAAIRFRLGKLRGGAQGAAEVEAARAAATALGAQPDDLVCALVPLATA